MSNWTHVKGKITLKVESKGWSDSPIYRIIADAPKITGSEGSAVFTIRPLSQFAINEGNNNYHEAEIIIEGSLRDRSLDETCEEIVNFVKYLKNERNEKTFVSGEIKVNEDDSVKIADHFYLETSKTFNLFS